MNTFKKSVILIACLLLLIGTSGCDQAEEAKKAASELVTQSVDKAKQAIGIESGKEDDKSDEKDDDESDDTGDSKEN